MIQSQRHLRNARKELLNLIKSYSKGRKEKTTKWSKGPNEL